MKYRPDIDGLRAIAILPVVVFHAFPGVLPGGFIGVDVFFVISGYLITSIILSNLTRNTFTFSNFYSRRVRRIFPSLGVVLLACLAVGYRFLTSDEYRQLGNHTLGGAAFVQNLILWHDVGYFDNASDTKPLLHLWSLAVEEQFYIFWPLLLALVVRWRIRIAWFIGAVAVASFVCNLALVVVAPSSAFYFPVPRFWELMAGALLAEISLRPGEPLSKWPAVQSSIGLMLIVLACAVLDEKHVFPGFWALLPTAGASLVVAAGSSSWVNRSLLANRPMVWIGKISYPLYLWHWPIFSLLRILLTEVPIGVRFVGIVASTLLAWGTYEVVERPFRSKSAARWLTVAPIVALLIAGSAGAGVWALEGLPKRAVNANDGAVFNFVRHWDGWNACGMLENSELGGCRVLKSGQPIDIMVIGDSHAGHLGSGLRELFATSDRNVAVLLYAGCFPVFSSTIEHHDRFVCPNHSIDRALKTAIERADVKVVVLAGYANLHIFGTRFHEPTTIGAAKALDNARALEQSLDATLGALTRAQKRVVFVIDVPEIERDPRMCFNRGLPFVQHRCNIDIERYRVEERSRYLLDVVHRLMDRHPAVRFVSSIDVLCDQSICHGSEGGTLMYASQDHLTPAGSRRVVEGLAKVLREVLDDR
jgi:peptidoglycan/LPS O-acetylase OafA/YrhL